MADTELALIDVPTGQAALAAFAAPFDTTIGPLLAPIAARVKAFDADAATEDGRARIKSFAYALARSKTALDGSGKAVVDKLKEMPKTIDANRKRARDMLEEWQASVRKPLDDWEAKEKARVDAHLSKIELIQKTGAVEGISLSVDGVMFRMKALDDMAPPDSEREEFADEYARVLRIALDALGKAMIARRAYDADQAELAALRKREAARAAQEAERKAAEEAERAAKEAIDRQAREAEAEMHRAQERAAAAEREEVLRRLKEQADADAAREGAERRRLEAEVAERRAADAKAAEDKRIAEAKAEQERIAAERKAQDKQHRAKVNREAAQAISACIHDSFASCDMDASQVGEIAKAIVTAIAKNEIPGVRIEY